MLHVHIYEVNLLSQTQGYNFSEVCHLSAQRVFLRLVCVFFYILIFSFFAHYDGQL